MEKRGRKRKRAKDWRENALNGARQRWCWGVEAEGPDTLHWPGAARAASIERSPRGWSERKKFLKSSNSSAKRWSDAGEEHLVYGEIFLAKRERFWRSAKEAEAGSARRQKRRSESHKDTIN